MGGLSFFLLLSNYIVFYTSVAQAFLLVAPSSNQHTRQLGRKLEFRSRLNAVADPPYSPAEHQDEDEKHEMDDDDDDDWTPTAGGFFANLTKRKSNKVQTIHTVDNIEDYKRVVVDEKDDIVVVRFHASWCRSCKTSEPVFKRLMKKFSGVKFVQVPLTKETAYLQEGLGVPSVPFAHIYHPDAGLVEEMKVSKPHLKKFDESVASYVKGSCDLPRDNDEDLNNANISESFQ